MRRSNNSVLQFFSDAEYQHHNNWYSYDRKYPVICTERRLPPWQVIGNANSVVNVELRRLETDTTDNLFNILGNPGGLPGFQVVEVETGVFNSIYDGLLQYTPATPIGHYQIEVTLSVTGDIFISEVFAIVDDVSELLKITWWHDEDFALESGVIEYTSGFKNFLYIPTDLGKPKYINERIVDERAGNLFKIYQVWKKVMFFDMLTTEGIADVVTKIGLHHHCEIEYYGEVYTINDFQAAVDWLPNGDICNIECRLEAGIVTQQTGKATIGAEYNDDYGDDYTI